MSLRSSPAIRGKLFRSSGLQKIWKVVVVATLAVPVGLGTTPAQAQNSWGFNNPASSFRAVTNASPLELDAITLTLNRLQEAARSRDPNALAFFGAGVPADDAPLRVDTSTTHVVVSPLGALVRQQYRITIQRASVVTLSSGVHELWLTRNADESFALSTQRFAAPPDALTELEEMAKREWQVDDPQQTGAVLDLIAVRLGGRWIALRQQRWTGQLVSAGQETISAPPREFLQEQMAAIPQGQAVIGHFMLQKGQRNWFGVGLAPNFSRRISAQADLQASQWRTRILSNSYLRAESHRDFGNALAAVNLWEEAADSYQKAELLQPGIVGATKLKEAETNRARDPLKVVSKQVEQEKTVGLGAEHPQYLISALTREQQAQPSALGSLRLALEYSRLAQEDRSLAWERSASQIEASGGARPQDFSWLKLLHEHLRERRQLAQIKPSNILRSPLFTVRVWPNDPSAYTLLAALEEARYTVYADFGIPMGNTEVLQWRTQSEFADYTTKFTAQGGSEFVAALTLTKLVSTRNGPVVLGEEINSYTNQDEPQSTFSTIAHEYGHVAVRQLARGRFVPVWFNEGVATSVEGGYEGYTGRVRRAANAGALLSMREMLEWNVDGQRAFLAYSQANSIVDYMVSKWGKNGVLEVLRQIGNDVPAEQAFRNVLGLSQYELWNRWTQEGIR